LTSTPKTQGGKMSENPDLDKTEVIEEIEENDGVDKETTGDQEDED